MLIDAAGSLITEAVVNNPSSGQDAMPLPFRPSSYVSSGTAIADYVKQFNPNGKTVDYWLNSHFDTDHMGNYAETYASMCPVSRAVAKHPEGNFYLNGINEVGTLLDFKKMIDRGYNSPIDRSGEKRFQDYIRFLDWTTKTKGTVHEVAKVGHDDQLVMNYNPSQYSDFKIRVLCGGGYYWTGNGVETKCNLPLTADGKPDQAAIRAAGPPENVYSVGLMLKWGKFDHFTAGDLVYLPDYTDQHPWFNAEAPVIPVVDRVEVMKANHHGMANANSSELIAKLHPQTILISPWRAQQPKPGCMNVLVKEVPNASIFSTEIAESQMSKMSQYSSNLLSSTGHIVVRVAADGTYKVFIVDNTSSRYAIRAIHGPYKSN